MFNNAHKPDALDSNAIRVASNTASVSHQYRPSVLFFAGDLGQRIFQMPLSRRSVGVDVRSRSGSLKVSYRTFHEIRI